VVFDAGVVELAGVRASLYLSPSEMEGYYLQYDRGEVSGEALREALARRGIVRGVLDGAVESVTRGSYTVGLPIVVARGKPARDELAPALEYRFDPDKIHLTFKEDTSVDFRDVMRLSFVRKEEALVLKRERTPGENGWTVTGKEVHFKVEPEQPFPRGTNTYVTENGRELRAAIDGHVEVRDGLVCVGQVFVIKGDVDYHTGHIEFDGSVMIGGDVKPEFEVKAKGNVEVFGSVDDAIIEAGGDVTVQFGVFAKGHGRVRAQGHVRARHFENVTVEAGRIYVAANAVNCGLYAREIVEVTGKPGTLVGGVTTARDYVFANTIGSELGTRTEVVVGDPAECDAQIEELKGLIRNESDEEELGALRAKLREAEEARRRLAMAKCHVFDRLYDGTCVRLFTTKRSFTEDVEHSTLLFDQERVRPFPFQYQDLQEDPTGAAGSEPLSVVAAES